MRFDPRKIEAQLALGRILPEKLPDIACDALQAGFDGPATVRLACLIKPGGWETDQLLPAFRQETGMTIPSKAEASVRIAYDFAIEAIESRADLIDLLRTLARLCWEADYPAQLMPLYSLEDELDWDKSSLYGRTEAELRNDARNELLKLIRDFEKAHNIH